jgi:Primosomal protein N'' (replication factor Y) - superfamily II helicase
MSLIKCHECGKEISDKADKCPNCGAPVIIENNSILSGPPNIPKPNKKRKVGCLIFIVIFVCVLGGGMINVINHPEKYQSSNNSSNVSKKDTKESLLELDKTSWKQFKGIYTSHNNFMTVIDAFTDNQITSLDFYNECKKAEEYFGKSSNLFSYGNTDDEKAYLSVFKSVALSDQLAAKYLKKYIDSGKTSQLSKAQESIQGAKDAITTIAKNRRKLLAKTGLSDTEIKTKIEQDMKDLEK